MLRFKGQILGRLIIGDEYQTKRVHGLHTNSGLEGYG